VTTFDDSPPADFRGMLDLSGRGFLVLGSGAGIGRQTVHALASCGAKVACVDVDDERAGRVAEEVGGFALSGDITRRTDVETIVATAAEQLGRIHGLVDIVGMARYASIAELDDETFDWEIDICLRHAFLLGQIAGRHMVANGGGSMVFVASVSGLTGAPSHAAYGAAKAGLMAWVKSIAVEMGPAQVRANAVAPGTTWTPRNEANLGEAGRRRNAANAPLGRVNLPADIAAAALFLSSDMANCISGHTIVVDAGVSAKFPYPMPGDPDPVPMRLL